MVDTADAMNFLRLGHLARSVDERPCKPALATSALPVGNEKRVFGELGAPGDHGCKQRWMQRLVRHYMRRGGLGVEGGFEPLAELRWIEQRETCVADLKEDLDKVKRKPMPGATGMVSSTSDE